jgi:hypothetical protein
MAPVVPAIAAAYIDAYVSMSDVSRERIEQWLPFVAAARLAENAPNEADALIAMASH